MRKFMLAALVLCLSAVTALAQSNTGNLVGTVVDQSGGAVAGATVNITDNATGRTRTIQASGEGTFTAAQLEVGTYTVRITAQGYKTFTATDLKIDVGKEYSLNATLEPGAVEETVTVVAGADVVNATSAELNTTVGQRQIQELPLNGRNPLALIGLQAGVASNGATSTVVNGQQSSFTNITRDGLNVQDNFIRSNATDFSPDRPNVDDVGEFTITTQNADASKGYGASQVELVTPRGSNEFHGAAFIYNRNSKFGANSFFNNFTRNPVTQPNGNKPFLNRNQFGGRFSGPLPLPRFGEGGDSVITGRGFFFGSYEGFRLRRSQAVTRTILTDTARAGIFRYRAACGGFGGANAACPAGITPGQILSVNVLTATGVTADPLIASRVLANVPTAGNNTNIGDQLNTTGLTFNQLQNQDRDSVTMRFDVEPSSKQSFSFVFGRRNELLLRPDVDAQQGGVAAGFNQTPFGFQDNITKTLVLAHRYSFTSTLTNEIRGGYSSSFPAFGRTNEPTDFFLQLPLINNPESGFQAQGRNTKYWNIQDNAVWILGNHSLRFGGQLQFFRLNPFGPGAFGAPTIPNLGIGTGPATPSFASLNVGTATDVANANALLALLGGIVSQANLQFNATSTTSGFVPGAIPQRNLHFENYSFYVTDSWRIAPEFTLNAGVRYELFTPIREPNRLALEPVIPDGADPISVILNPVGTYNFVGGNAGSSDGDFFKLDKNNFAPVVSFAWSPNFKNNFLGSVFPGEGRTVLRGGYRISYVNDEFVRGADNALIGNAGLSTGVTLTGLNRRASQGPPAIPQPPFQVPLTFAQANTIATNFGTVFAIDPDLKVPMTQEYNIGIQREIGFQSVFELRYVGGRSNNLIRGIDYNQINIFRGGFLEDFERARRNLALVEAERAAIASDPTLNAQQRAAALAARPVSAAFNANVVGSVQLPVIGAFPNGGLLANGTILGLIRTGQPAQLGFTYITNPGLFGQAANFLLPNPNAGVADLLSNSARYRYNSLQAEVRRRFAQGLQFQVNYTFQKTLTDTGGVAQQNFDPLLDINRPQLEYSRADYDAAHVFNFNGIYELPFGRGKRWLNDGGAVNAVLGGWQLTSIVQVATGAPFSILDTRGSLNRTGRSARQTANSNLSKDEIKDLVGIFRTPCGVFFINPAVLNINQTNLANGVCTQLAIGGQGFGATTFGTPPAPNQVFFQSAPGQTGNLERNFLNGPLFVNWDASLIKNIPLDFIREGMRFQIRGEVFNVLNRPNFFIGNVAGVPTGTSFDINSTNFGRVNSTFGFDVTGGPRVVQFVGRLEF